jgi:hypothetical protein
VKKNLDEPEYWRNLAKDARREANKLSSLRSKQTILEVAHAYERLADRKEKAARVEPSGYSLTSTNES